MRVARYYSVPEDVLHQFEEFKTKSTAFKSAEENGHNEPYAVLKVLNPENKDNKKVMTA